MAAINKFSLWAICFLSTALFVQAIGRAGLNRNQRQTITGELATGLTGTGTSFNSLNGGDYSYQQQSILNQPGIDDYGTYGRRPAGVGIAGSLGGYGGYGGVDRYDGVISDSITPTTAYTGSMNWNGFGYGKYGRGSGGRYPAGGYGGVKY